MTGLDRERLKEGDDGHDPKISNLGHPSASSVLRKLSHRAITPTHSRSREPTKGLRVPWCS